MGVISMMSSRQPGDGPRRRGDHPDLADRAQDEGAARRACRTTTPRHDNFRVKRYIAKYTINPAIAQGIAHEVGSVEVGKWADLVVWKPAFFGVKPSLILKGGMIAAAAMGDPNASHPDAAAGALPADVRGVRRARCTTPASASSRRPPSRPAWPSATASQRRLGGARRRTIGKRDMVHNSATPKIEVDAQTYEVRADGVLLTCEPATVLPMAQRYFLF